MPSFAIVTKVLVVASCLIQLIGNTSCQDHYNFHEDKLPVFEFDGPKPQAQLVELTTSSGLIESTGKPAHTPIVFWHGMGDTAKGSVTIDKMALEKKYPGIKIYSIQIGKTIVEDELAGYFSNVNDQVEQACQRILSEKFIQQAGELNAIGFSQGAQFMRALIQRCPFRENGIRIKNFISLGGQHQGVYGLPNCNSAMFCDYIRHLLTVGAYERNVQEHLVQAEYWHDPMKEREYSEKNIFLSDINNELARNQSYIENLAQLDNLVLVKFEQDEMVVPRESSHFEFYYPNQSERIQPLSESKLWLEDRLGLRQLGAQGRLTFLSVPGRHLQYKMSWFLQEIGEKYLKN